MVNGASYPTCVARLGGKNDGGRGEGMLVGDKLSGACVGRHPDGFKYLGQCDEGSNVIIRATIDGQNRNGKKGEERKRRRTSYRCRVWSLDPLKFPPRQERGRARVEPFGRNGRGPKGENRRAGNPSLRNERYLRRKRRPRDVQG
jgi:hypothetical protein